MLNRIVIINSELYAKASICIADHASIQITAENNVGKSSFLNSLNFLYITDKDQMRFEDNRRLSESMKHYFGGSSLHSFIIFEIFKNGYYCILVKATPENTIEYYKINGEYKESFFIETSQDGFKPKKWQTVLQELTNFNPIDPPILLKNDELYNLVYNSDKKKNPVVWIKREVKRKGNAFSNSFTDIYKYLIRTSEINEKSFRNALLIADSRQNTCLDIFTTSSFEKVQKFEKKKEKLDNLISIKPDFEKLKLLNHTFISEEILLGKLKNTFIKKFDAVEKTLSEQTAPNSSLSISIVALEHKINTVLKKERDDLIIEKANLNNEIKVARKDLEKINQKLKEVQDYEPEQDNLLFQGLVARTEKETKKRIELEGRLSLLERNNFTIKEINSSIENLKVEISIKEYSIAEFNDLLYQNISSDPVVTKMVYSYLSSDLTKLDKSKIIQKITKADLPLTFFDGQIDVSSISIKELPTIAELQADISVKMKEMAEKEMQLDAVTNRDTLQSDINILKNRIRDGELILDKIKNKPALQRLKLETDCKINESLKNNLSDVELKIIKKDEEIDIVHLTQEGLQKKQKDYKDELDKFKSQHQKIIEKYEIDQIEEILEEPFEGIYEKFNKIYLAFSGSNGTRDSRTNLKNTINLKLKKDNQDIKQFIQQIEEEISTTAQLEKAINTLLETLSHEISSPTFTFLSHFSDFKTFVSRSYNVKLARYPISNIKSVKVKIAENTALLEDLEKISKLKFSNSNMLDFDNSFEENKRALERQLLENKGKQIDINSLFSIKVEITKVTGEKEEIDLSKQVQSRGTSIVLKLYLFLNILKDLVHSSPENKIIIYIDELDAIGQKNVTYLNRFCTENNFVPIFAAPRKVEGIQKYYMIKETNSNNQNTKPKISFGELQSFPVVYRNAEPDL